MKKSVFFAFTILLAGLNMTCEGLHLGMRFRRVPLIIPGNDSVYCYRFDWGLGNSWCHYLSSKKEVCGGFDTTADIGLGMGEIIIYYRWEKDTLCLYANSKPTIPKMFSVPVKFTSFDNDNTSWRRYDSAVKQNSLREIIFDSVGVEAPCSLKYDKETKHMQVSQE